MVRKGERDAPAATVSKRPLGAWLIPLVSAAAIVVVGVTLVALTLRRPELPTYAPTPPAPKETGRALVGPVLYTVDARDAAAWHHFSFRLGAVIDDAGPTQWDLAFRRFQIIVNGGPGFQGRGGILDLGQVAFEKVEEVRGGRIPGERGRAESGQPGHRQLVQLRLLLTRPDAEAARLGGADGGRAVREDRDRQLLLSGGAAGLPDVPVRLSGRRLDGRQPPARGLSGT
jgi:hypothetical protein